MNKFDGAYIDKFQPPQCHCGYLFKPIDIHGKYYKCPRCKRWYNRV